MRAERRELALSIVMEDPVPGVAIAVQRGATGKAQIIPPASVSPSALSFELDVVVEGRLSDGRPRFLGPNVQGPPQARFVYLCVGQAAGQIGSAWSRRVKVPLGGLSCEAIEALPSGARLEAHIGGRARDGGPACATVPILPPGWRVSS